MTDGREAQAGWRLVGSSALIEGDAPQEVVLASSADARLIAAIAGQLRITGSTDACLATGWALMADSRLPTVATPVLDDPPLNCPAQLSGAQGQQMLWVAYVFNRLPRVRRQATLEAVFEQAPAPAALGDLLCAMADWVIGIRAEDLDEPDLA